MNDRKRVSSSTKPSPVINRRSARGLLVGLLVLAGLLSGLFFPFSTLADGGGWPSPTFIIIPTLNFPTATLFPTVDLSNLNQMLITEPTPTPTLFIAPTPLPSGGGGTLSYLCLPMGIGLILVLILASLMIMRRRQI